MKDFWDLVYLILEFDFDGLLLRKAVKATFNNRQTTLPKTVSERPDKRFRQNRTHRFTLEWIYQLKWNQDLEGVRGGYRRSEIAIFANDRCGGIGPSPFGEMEGLKEMEL